LDILQGKNRRRKILLLPPVTVSVGLIWLRHWGSKISSLKISVDIIILVRGIYFSLKIGLKKLNYSVVNQLTVYLLVWWGSCLYLNSSQDIVEKCCEDFSVGNIVGIWIDQRWWKIHYFRAWFVRRRREK